MGEGLHWKGKKRRGSVIGPGGPRIRPPTIEKMKNGHALKKIFKGSEKKSCCKWQKKHFSKKSGRKKIYTYIKKIKKKHMMVCVII